MQLHDVDQGIIAVSCGNGWAGESGRATVRPVQGADRPRSREGFKLNPIFEGGQIPLAERIPKRDFFNGAFKNPRSSISGRHRGELRPRRGRSTRPPCEPRGSSRGTISTGSNILGRRALTKAGGSRDQV